MTQQGGIGGEACLDQEAPLFVLGHPSSHQTASQGPTPRGLNVIAAAGWHEQSQTGLFTGIALHNERLWPASGTQRSPLEEGKGNGGEDRRRINKNQLNPQFEQSK